MSYSMSIVKIYLHLANAMQVIPCMQIMALMMHAANLKPHTDAVSNDLLKNPCIQQFIVSFWKLFLISLLKFIKLNI